MKRSGGLKGCKHHETKVISRFRNGGEVGGVGGGSGVDGSGNRGNGGYGGGTSGQQGGGGMGGGGKGGVNGTGISTGTRTGTSANNRPRPEGEVVARPLNRPTVPAVSIPPKAPIPTARPFVAKSIPEGWMGYYFNGPNFKNTPSGSGKQYYDRVPDYDPKKDRKR